MRISDAQKVILTRLSDGALHNLYAWPLQRDPDDMFETICLLFSAGLLGAQDFVEIDEEDDTTVWLRITPAGRMALREMSA